MNIARNLSVLTIYQIHLFNYLIFIMSVDASIQFSFQVIPI